MRFRFVDSVDFVQRFWSQFVFVSDGVILVAAFGLSYFDFIFISMLFLWQSSSGCSLKTQIMCIFSVFFYFRIFRCPFTEQICHKRPCLINLHIHMERRSSFEQTAYRLSIKNGV